MLSTLRIDESRRSLLGHFCFINSRIVFGLVIPLRSLMKLVSDSALFLEIFAASISSLMTTSSPSFSSLSIARRASVILSSTPKLKRTPFKSPRFYAKHSTRNTIRTFKMKYFIYSNNMIRNL
jgi:hypothetical protein